MSAATVMSLQFVAVLMFLAGIVGKMRLHWQYFDCVLTAGQGPSYFFDWRRRLQPWERTVADYRGLRDWLRRTGRTRQNHAMTALIVLGVAAMIGLGQLGRPT